MGQIVKSVSVVVSLVCLCMYVSVCGHTIVYGRIFQPIFTKFGKEELVRLGSKSENAF